MQQYARDLCALGSAVKGADVNIRGLSVGQLLPMRKQIFDEAKKQGLVISGHTLSGNATGRDDFSVMFLEEYKNWAAFDGIHAKYRTIERMIVGPEEKQVQLMTKRTDVREIIGEKRSCRN